MMLNRKIDQKGFTLVEVMVALVVLSIGLLGIAAMQLQGLKNAHSSYQRTIASIIAMDASERLWIKLAEGTLDGTDVDNIETAWRGIWDLSPGVNNAIGLPLVEAGATCTDTNADHTCIFQNGNQYTIWVIWQESRFVDEGTTSSFQYVMNLLP